MSLSKLFNRIFFHNNTTPALDEDNFNAMSKAINDIDDRVIDLAGTIMEDVPQIQEDIEELEEDFELIDGKITEAQAAATSAQNSANEAAGSVTSAQQKALIAEGWAKGTQNGSPVSQSSPYWQNNAEYFKDQAKNFTPTGYQDLVDDVEDVKQTLTSEVTNRTNAVSSEASARMVADANLQSQITQAISPSGEAPSVEEVTNARIGADGITYSSLGEAIRTQLNTKEYRQNSSFLGGDLLGTELINIEQGGISGGADINQGRRGRTVGYIRVTKGTVVKYADYVNYYPTVWFYDKNKTYTNNSGVLTANYTINFDGYIRISFQLATNDYYTKSVCDTTKTLLTISSPQIEENINGRLTPVIKNAQYRTYYAYFTGPSTPIFEYNITTYAVKITLPKSRDLKIFGLEGLVKTLSISDSNREFTIDRDGHKLILNLTDNDPTTAIYVASATAATSANSVILFEFSRTAVSGLLAKFYYAPHKEDIMYWFDERDIIPKMENLKYHSHYLEDGNFTIGDEPIVLFHLSDSHAANFDVEKIIKFYNQYSNYIDDVIHTGDTVQSYYSEDGTTFRYWDWTGFGDKILNVIGNHDAWVYQGQNATAAEDYQKFFAPYIEDWGLTSYTENLCYYYKDYSSRVRLIVLDCMHYDSTQEEWLQTTLADAKTNGLAVAIAVHFLPIGNPTPFDCAFNFPVDVGSDHAFLDASAAAVVENFILSGGEFIAWMCGHTHTNYIGTVPDYPHQIAFSIDKAFYSDDQSNGGARRQNSISEICANLVSIDTSSKLLKLCRIGANTDQFLRRIGTMCCNYKTATFLYESI